MRAWTIIRIMLMLIVGCASLLLASCEQENVDLRSPKPQKNDTPRAPSRTFAIIYPMTHPFFESITKNAAETAKKLNVNIIVKAPDEAFLEQQIRMMENLIKQHVDGIAIDPIDAEALTPYINKAIKAGIQVVCFDADAPQSSRLSYIGPDNQAAGEHMGEMIARLLKGRGMIIAETGMESMLNLKQRSDGMLKYLSKYPDIVLLQVKANEGDAGKAQTDIEQLIEAHPHFDAFIGMDSLSGSSSILIWKAMGLKNTSVTFNAMPDILEGIKNGQITLAISQGEFKWGELIVRRLNEASDGKAIPIFDNTGTQEVSSSNVKEFEKSISKETEAP